MNQLKSKNLNKEICQIPRWTRYKAMLNNMNYVNFMAAALTDENGLLVDVRTPQEYDNQIIEGAVNINYLSQNLADELETLDKRKNYYIFCRTGRRSLRVCMLMQNSGFKVINLDGGLIAQ